jgi:hypothetical protein
VSGNLVSLEMVREGLIAGVAIAMMSAIVILLTGQYLYDQSAALAIEGDRSSLTFEWMFRWAAISLVFGVAAAYAYNFTVINLAWNGTHYLVIAIALMVVLDILAFVPMYNGEIAPYAFEWLGLNATFGIGFGILVPMLVGH